MDTTNKKTLFTLSQKSLSVIAASVAVLTNTHANATVKTRPHPTTIDNDNAEINFKNMRKPKLVLKLNVEHPERSIMSMHTSHSSHSSHASHASSSPDYTPSPEPVTVRPAPVVSSIDAPADTVSQRTLYKGCQGQDVKRVQLLLKQKGYKVPVSGYFGQQTEAAVKKFQVSNDLPVDGKVGGLTLTTLANSN